MGHKLSHFITECNQVSDTIFTLGKSISSVPINIFFLKHLDMCFKKTFTVIFLVFDLELTKI